jgi:type VI secretion system protein ImpL
MIAALVNPLRTRWVWSLIWAIGFALILWFFGALFAFAQHRPLESDMARIIACALVFALWAAFNLQIQLRAHQTNRHMIRDLTRPAMDDKGGGNGAAELRQLRERLQEALVLLRKKSGGRGPGRSYLYQLPWYLMIGPPGSGKSTALLTSGLNFPLSGAIGRDPLRGIGGTRNCDWWFTDEAILLDTAGRYTTQDSDPRQDQAAWLGFLDLLKHYRPRQPVNGAIVVLSLADLMAPDPTERLQHARAIRQRLNELYDRFGIRFPVYVLFTKVDLVPGFVEFFDGVGQSEREQVWGVTYPLDEGTTPGIVDLFPPALEGMVGRLNGQLLERLQQEVDVERRGLVYGFPNQMASLADAMLEILNEVFRPSRYEARPLLRGTYFTSSIQTGTPIDRTMAAITNAFGLDPVRTMPSSRQGRSYFLTRLFRQVIFAEAAVVSLDPRAERRHRTLRTATYGIAIVVLAVLAYAWGTGYFENKRMVATINARLDTYDKDVADIPTRNVADDDFTRVVPPLDILRDLPTGLHNTEGTASRWLTFGLYQGDKLLSMHEAVYRRALNGLLLPRLLVHLQNQIQAHQSDNDFVTGALRIYLMLGSQGPLDANAVKQWMTADWAVVYPGDANARLRADLAHHLDALLVAPMAQIPLDARLIGQARGVLQKLSPAERVYTLVREREAVSQLPEWRVVDHAGAMAQQIFTRASGKKLTDGIPGLYTDEGYYGAFLPALDAVMKDVQGQSWVIGDKSGASEPDNLRHDALQLYYADYTKQWDALLNDLRIVPATDMQQTATLLDLMSGPDMPLATLLKSIAAETQLAPPGTKPGTPAPPVAAGSPPATGIAAVAQHFRPIDDLVTPVNGVPAQLDDLIRALNNAYQALSGVSSAPGQGQAILPQHTADGQGSAVVQQLTNMVPQLPSPVSGWIASIAGNISGVAASGVRQQLSDLWGGAAGNFCERVVDGRYPFYKKAKRDASIEDFTRLFAPGGLLDSFFDTHLRVLVDTSSRVWSWQKVDNADLGIPPDVLIAFQYAAAIRDSFFADGGQKPHFSFQVTPEELDPKTTGALFATSGQQLEYRHGPHWPTTFQWPDPDPNGTSKVAFETSEGEPNPILKTGAWSLFHLIDSGHVSTTADGFRVDFSGDGHDVTYDIRSNSAFNPLALKDLRDFRCPASF